MRLNNFSENSIIDSKQQQNTKESIASDQNSPIQVELIQNPPKNNARFLQKDLLKSSGSHTKLQRIITQHSQTALLSNIETLGIIILKIMTHQFVDHGYSSTKLNIIKSINDMQKNKIYEKFLQLYNFKTSSLELMTILNSSTKLINKELSSIGLDGNYLNLKKNVQYELRCLKVHKIIMNHLKQFPICWQFFNIFMRLILLLVNYPAEKLYTQNMDAREIFFILCDYLGCKIDEKQSIFLIENIHYISFSQKLIQFGLAKQLVGNENQIQTLKKNTQSRSTNDLLKHNNRPVKQTNHSTGNQQSSKTFSNGEKQGIKQQFYIEKLKIQKCLSRIQIKYREQNLNHSKISKSPKHQLKCIKNTSSSVYIQKNNNFQNHQRKSINFPSFKNFEHIDYKCQKCTMKKQLTLQSNTVSLEVN